MDSTNFDSVARLFGRGMTRRAALRGLVAGTSALTAGGVLLRAEDASAKRRRKKKTKKTQKQTQTVPIGARCQTSSQCPASYICDVPVNGANSDRYCSGGPGAICGAKNEDGDDTAPFCAVGHRCVFNFIAGNTYTCQAVPDEI